MTLLRGLGAAAVALVVLQQADRGIWWHVCNFRGIRTKADPEQLYQNRDNKFFVAVKLVPAAVACVGVAWIVAVDHALAGLVISLIGIVAFGVSSLVLAYRAIGPA